VARPGNPGTQFHRASGLETDALEDQRPAGRRLVADVDRPGQFDPGQFDPASSTRAASSRTGSAPCSAAMGWPVVTGSPGAIIAPWKR
jgi:hypothetical protein